MPFMGISYHAVRANIVHALQVLLVVVLLG